MSFQELWSTLLTKTVDFEDMADWWDLMAKPNIRKLAISYSRFRQQGRKDTIAFLYICLSVAIQGKDWDEVVSVKARLTQLQYEDLFGIVLRSKKGQVSEVERASLYHLGRELKGIVQYDFLLA